MNKNYKIYLAIAVGILVIVAVIMVVFQNTKPSSTGNGEPLPSAMLTPQEESLIKEVVKNFVSLYNSYSTYDYGNLRSLGDLETVRFQQKMLDYISYLENTVPKGYEIRTDANDATFSYTYPEADVLNISIKATVKEMVPLDADAIPEVKKYTTTAHLILRRQNNTWLVDDINFIKD